MVLMAIAGTGWLALFDNNEKRCMLHLVNDLVQNYRIGINPSQPISDEGDHA
jgi:hypothetical protein